MKSVKAKRGRPPANKDLDLTSLKNFNINNQFPPYQIVGSKTADQHPTLSDATSVTYVYIKCNDPKTFELLMDSLKIKSKFVMMIFDATGFCYTNDRKTLSNNKVADFECKIFPDNLVAYSMSDVRKRYFLLINVEEMHKIFKSIPSKTEFSMSYCGYDDGAEVLHINYVDLERKKKSNFAITITRVPVNYMVVKIPASLNQGSIVMMESKEFEKTCKNKQSLDYKIMHITSTRKGISFSVGSVNGNFTGDTIYSECKKLVIIRKPTMPIKVSVSLAKFIKYLKLHKISDSVKLYIGPVEQLIIEYTIGNGLGVFQLIVPQEMVLRT